MGEDKKKPGSPRPKLAAGSGYSFAKGLNYHFSSYGGTTFKDMKKKAEKALSDHEFKD